MLFFRIVKPTSENVPISVHKISDHQFPSLSLIDKNKTNGFVKVILYLITVNKCMIFY